jgi:hypothetical protein
MLKQEVLGRTNRLLSFDMRGSVHKITAPTILTCGRKDFTELLPGNDRGDTRTDPQTHASNNSSIVAWIRCYGNVFTESLPSNEKRNTFYQASA